MSEERMEALKKRIRHVPDFPKPGILFYDVTTLLQDSSGFQMAVEAMTEPHQTSRIDVVVGIESRGFIFGSAVADRLKTGFAPVRKPGKLPSKTRRASYSLEYGTDSLEIHEDAVRKGQRVLIVDDLLATGGTAAATVKLVRELGADVVGIQFLIELVGLEGRRKLTGENIGAVLAY
jgi:adenine phosphoribosyltransferase